MSSVEDTKNNPITSTVEVVDGKLVEFPAVTIAKKPLLTSAYRFIATIYDSFKFDCSHDLERSYQCMEETKNIRSDFQPLIESLIEKINKHWDYLMAQEDQFGHTYYATEWFGPIFSHWEDQEAFFLGICNLTHFEPLGFNSIQQRRAISTLAENFQISLKDFELAMRSFVAEASQQAEETSPFLQPNSTGYFYYDCSRLTVSLFRWSKYTSWVKAMLMLWRSAESEELLSLGDILLFAHDQLYAALVETNKISPNNNKRPSSSLPDQMFNILTQETGQLTADEIVRFVSYSNTGIRSIESNFKQNLATHSNCTNITFENYNCYKQRFHSNLTHAMRVLKYLVQPAHSNIHPGQINEEFKMAAELAKDMYSSKCSFAEGNCHNHDPAFRHCHFGHAMYDEKIVNSTEEDCSFFRRTFGTKGISYEFNPRTNFFDIYSERNEYNRMFYKEVHSQDIDSKIKRVILDNENTLDFFIYPDSIEKYFLSDSELSELHLAIHHPTTIPIKFKKLERGYRYTITVTPSMITTDKELIDIPESKRGCRFRSEHNCQKKGHVFASYSQHGCLFECQLNKAFSGPNATNCLPWDSPHVEDPISICHRDTSAYFDLSPYEKEPTGDCDCPVDCNVYGYSYTWDRHPLAGMCDTLLKNPWQKLFLFLNNNGESDNQYENSNECGNRIDKLLTRVTINMDTNMVTNTRRMRRTTIADQIASLGGLVGLFTGMSMLTMMEIVMWIGRVVMATIFCWKKK